MSDFLNDVKDSVGELDILEELVTRLKNVRADILIKEDELKKLKDVERELSQGEIPTFLQSRGIDLLKLNSGEVVEVKDEIKISLPKDPKNRNIVLNYIIQNGGSGIIKEELTIDSPEELVKNFLIEQGIPFKDDKTVHSSTLKAFFNDLLGFKKNSVQKINIEDVPKEANLFVYKKTNIK